MEDSFMHNGYRIRIVPDEDPADPEDCDNPIYLVHVHDQLYRIPKKGLPFDNENELREFFTEIGAPGNFDHPDWAIFPLSSYIHSGVVLSLLGENNFPDQQWDVSRCGWIFIKKDGEWYDGNPTDEQYHTLAEGHVRMWNQYLSGDIWGYVIESLSGVDEDGEYEEVESCWGFYGRDDCIEEAKSIAEGRNPPGPPDLAKLSTAQIVAYTTKLMRDACKGHIVSKEQTAEEYAEEMLSLHDAKRGECRLVHPLPPVAVRFLYMILATHGITMDIVSGRITNEEGEHIGDVDIPSVRFNDLALACTFTPKVSLEYITIDLVI